MIENDAGRKLQTTQTSMQVLELVLKHDGLTLAELNEMLDKPKSTLHSHLTTLTDCRYLVRRGNTYEVSFRLALLGNRVRHKTDFNAIVTEIVEDLNSATEEETNFTVMEHGRLLLVHGTSGGASDDDQRGEFRTEYYMHNTAAGKAILAEMERDRVERILDEWGMPREAEATITDREQLFEELAEIAEQGYSVVDEEVAPGLVGVGATVHKDERIIGGLSVGGPKYRIDTPSLHSDIVEELLEAVDRFEEHLHSN